MTGKLRVLALTGAGVLAVVVFSVWVKTGNDSASYQATPSYFQSVIPPCIKAQTSSRDPCNPRRSPQIGSSSAAIAFLEFPKYWDLYHEGIGGSELFVPHLVIRATFLPDTTRCKMYERRFPAFVDYSMSSEHRLLICFTDARVNDYLMGTGPPELTVGTYSTPFMYSFGDPLDWFENVKGEVVRAYEGREGVIFLMPSTTTAVESWTVLEVWDVKNANDEITVVAPYKETLESIGIHDITSGDLNWRPLSDDEKDLLEVPLDEFEKIIATAAVRRTAKTGGKTAVGDDFPMLITDANLLRPYYEGPGVGIDYETDAPAKPPPVPGEEDPVYPPGQVNDHDGPPTVTFPANEEPTPPPDTDTTTTTTTTLPPSKTTTTVGS